MNWFVTGHYGRRRTLWPRKELLSSLYIFLFRVRCVFSSVFEQYCIDRFYDHILVHVAFILEYYTKPSLLGVSVFELRTWLWLACFFFLRDDIVVKILLRLLTYRLFFICRSVRKKRGGGALCPYLSSDLVTLGGRGCALDSRVVRSFFTAFS